MGETCTSAATLVTATPPSGVWLYDGRTPGNAVAVERKDSAGWSHFLFFLRMLNIYNNWKKKNTHIHTVQIAIIIKISTLVFIPGCSTFEVFHF